MRIVFFISLILIPFLSISQSDYKYKERTKSKDRDLTKSQQFEYATLKWLITSEQKNNASKRSVKNQKDVNLKKVFASETSDLKFFLSFGTEFKSDENMRILKKIHSRSYNNIVDVLNELGYFGWNLTYVDESIVEEGKMITYYFKK